VVIIKYRIQICCLKYIWSPKTKWLIRGDVQS